MEEVFNNLDSNHLSKLAKIIPQKISGFSAIPKKPSPSYKNKLFKQFMKEKNLNYIYKYISNGNFHDILVKDIHVYENIIYKNRDDFFKEIQGKSLQSPFSFYIYLIEQNDETVITDFFNDIDGIIDFRGKAIAYLERDNKNIDHNLEEYDKAIYHVEKFQQKITEIEKLNSILLKENNKLKKKIDKNNNDKNREINNLEKKYQDEKKVENSKYDDILRKNSIKNQNTEKKCIELEKEILNLKNIIENKDKKINELEKKNKEFIKLMKNKLGEKNEENTNLMNILLIGTPGKVSVREDYNFEFVDPNASIEIIGSIIEKNKISELWITNFQTIPRKKKKIIQNFKNVLKVQELNDFTMLMSGGS